MSARLSPPDTSASRCEYCEHEGMGEEKNIIHTIVNSSLRRIRHEAKLRGYVSILPRRLFVILALVWASPCHLSPSSQAAGRAKHPGGCREAERQTRCPGNG